MNLTDIVFRKIPPEPWRQDGKIPWHEPAFSQRMLQNHLSQAHDWASRRFEVVEKQVSVIAQLLSRRSQGVSVQILDLGCGPGFYTNRLARMGHHCVGVDFSPASIAYAEEKALEDHVNIVYELADVRTFETGERFDLVMMTFGGLNVFQPEEAKKLLEKAKRYLKPKGMLLIEVHTFEEVQRQGLQPPSWQADETGLFMASPHLCLEEHFWHEKAQVATTRFWVVDAETATTQVFYSSMKAYQDDDYRGLLGQLGSAVSIEQLSPQQWPVGDVFAGKLLAYVAHFE